MEENFVQLGDVEVCSAKYAQPVIQKERNHLIDYFFYF
jgi:hypothetical protein